MPLLNVPHDRPLATAPESFLSHVLTLLICFVISCQCVLDHSSLHAILMASKTCNVDNAELDEIQKKNFTKWINKHLRKVSRTVEDLFVDLRDGRNLISLLEVLSAEGLLREKGRAHFHRVLNIQHCLDWLKMKSIRLVNIRPEEIVEGNGKVTLGLIWLIILYFQLEALEGRSAKEALLAWNQRATEGYVRVTNFTTSWRDGRAFSAILHRVRPAAIDWEQVNGSSMTNRERLANAFEVAKREFDVDKLLDPEDVDRNTPDEKSIILYTSTLYKALPNLPETTKALSAVSDDVVARCTTWATGVLTRLESASEERAVREAGRARIDSSSGEGGVEATVKRETDEAAVVMAEIELTRSSFEAFLLVLSGETGDHHAAAVAELRETWNRIQLLVSTRQRALEVTVARKTEVEGELASLRSRFSEAEISLADAGPISRLPVGQETRREQSELVEEIEKRKPEVTARMTMDVGRLKSALEQAKSHPRPFDPNTGVDPSMISVDGVHVNDGRGPKEVVRVRGRSASREDAHAKQEKEKIQRQALRKARRDAAISRAGNHPIARDKVKAEFDRNNPPL